MMLTIISFFSICCYLNCVNLDGIMASYSGSPGQLSQRESFNETEIFPLQYWNSYLDFRTHQTSIKIKFVSSKSQGWFFLLNRNELINKKKYEVERQMKKHFSVSSYTYSYFLDKTLKTYKAANTCWSCNCKLHFIQWRRLGHCSG